MLEVIPEKLVPHLNVEYHVLVRGTRLIVDLPATVDYLQGASLYKLLCFLFLRVVLTQVPIAKVFSFIVSESSRRVVPE